MYEFYIDKVRFPVTPSKYQLTINGNNETVTLINGGEINLLKPSGLSEVTFDLRFPWQEGMPYTTYQGGKKGFHSADHYIRRIKKWKTSRKAVKLKILRKIGTEEFEQLSMRVAIEDYEIKEDTEEGFDVIVTLKLKQCPIYGAQKVKVKKKKDDDDKLQITTDTKKRESKDTATSYIVKKGDSLWKIAQKELKNGVRHTELYDLNKDAIEKDAKKNGRKSSSRGRWIYPGLKLKLPK